MRVYEFAKQHDLSNKEVVAVLQEAGSSVGNHMSVLSDDEVEYLEGHFKLSSKNPHEAQSAPQDESTPSVESEPTKQEAKPVGKPKRSTSTQSSEPEDDTLVLQPVLLGELADKIKYPASELILFLLKKGVMANRNQLLSVEQVKALADHFEIPAVEPKKHDEEQLEKVTEQEGLEPRLPIVVVMGHVDHGKTTLLDFVRKARVAAREKGGITQHLGAYEVPTDQGNIIFLDTPGHEAFTIMRMRGVKVADVAVLMVAADDGVMPQTKEAISQAKAMDVPIIVAINKVDKVDPTRIEQVKTELSQNDLLPEDWGGDVPCVPISALEGTGVDDLLELIGLQAEVMELKARQEGPGSGYILESKVEKGRGAVATLILQHGVAQLGDYFTAGATGGRINSIVDSYGKRLKKVGPSVPVQIGGFDALPAAGASYEIVPFAEYKKHKASKPTVRHSVDIAQSAAAAGSEDAFKVLIKADVNSSKEAVVQAMAGISKKLEVPVVVIHSGVGPITESDVDRASTAGAHIYGFGVKADANAAALARKLNTPVDTYFVIYHLLDAVKEAIEKTKTPEVIEVKSGEAEVRKVFNIKGVGVIAGCYVKSGKIVKPGKVVAYRNGEKIGEGPIRTLQKEKKTLKEVAAGFECAFIVDGLEDWQEGDMVECYVEETKK